MKARPTDHPVPRRTLGLASKPRLPPSATDGLPIRIRLQLIWRRLLELRVTIVSSCHENRKIRRFQHGCRHAAENAFAQPRMAIGAHDDQVAADLQ